MKTLDSKDPVEIVPVTFEFESAPAGAVSIEVSVSKGRADPDVNTMLAGVHQVSGNNVVQHVQAGLDDRDYLLRCIVDDAPAKYVNACILPVRYRNGK